MPEPLIAIVGLLLAGVLLWVRRFHVRRDWVRVLLLVVAVLFAYPALNASYITTKSFVARFLSINQSDIISTP